MTAMDHLRRSDGFTLLELIIAAAVMSITVMSIYQFFISVRDINRFASNLVVVNQVANQQMEVYRNTAYNDLTVGTTSVASILTPYPQLHTPRSASVTITEPQVNGYKQVVLTITYTDKGGLKTDEVTTLIAARGVNK